MSRVSRRTFLGTSAVAGAGAAAAASPGNTGQAAGEQPRFVMLNRTSLPVLRSADVIIAGGSFAGVAAALAFAKAGRSVVLVEPRTYLGREITATLRPWVPNSGALPAVLQLCTGVDNPPQYPNPSVVPSRVPVIKYTPSGDDLAFKPDKLKLSLEDQLLKAGVELIYASLPVGVCVEEGTLTGLIVGNKSSRQVIKGRLILDTTETAVVAHLAGAAFEPVREGTVKYKRTIEFERVSPPYERTLTVPAGLGIDGNTVTLHRGYRGDGHVLVEFALALPVREFEPAEASRREMEGRRRGIALASHLVKQVPAFQKAFLSATSYELRGPHTSRMDLPEPAWAKPLPALEAPGGAIPLAAFAGPVKGLWCLEAARLEPARAEAFRDAVPAVLLGEAFGRTAAAQWNAVSSAGGDARPAVAVAAAGGLEVKEHGSPQRGRAYEQYPVAATQVPVYRTVDVLVAGGGTSGATAGAVAAREGVRTLVVDMNPALGGTGTIAGVDSYWFGRRVGFSNRVAARVAKVHESIGYQEEKSDTPRWNIEGKMFALQCEVEEAGTEALFNTILTGAVVEGNQVRGAVLATRYGLRAVLSKVVVDASGDGDVAALAGAEFVYCSAMDHYGMWFNFAQFLTPGRNVNHFMSSVDVRNVEDITRAVLAGRRRGNNCHDHGIYIAARETRHILGDRHLTKTDIYRCRRWQDVVSIHYSNSDMKGRATSTWFLIGMIAPHYEVEIPYGALLPKRVENVVVAGKAFSTTHDALAGIRQQPDLENLGGIAALAAAKAVKEGKTPRRIDVGELQQRLVKEGILSQIHLTRKLKPRGIGSYSNAQLKALVEATVKDRPILSYQKMEMFEIFNGRIPFIEVATAGPRVVPYLEEALASAQGEARRAVAKALAVHGSHAAVPVLIAEIMEVLGSVSKVPARTNEVYHSGFPPDMGGMPDIVYLMFALGLTRDKRSIPVWQRVADILDPQEKDFKHRYQDTYCYVDAVCFGAERLADPAAIPVLEKLHSYPTLRHQGSRKGPQPDYFRERQAMCELAIGKAMSRCGSASGYALVISYLDDNRAMLAEQAHSHLVRITGRDCGKNGAAWTAWLKRAAGSLTPQPLVEDLDIAYEPEILTD